MNTRFRINTTLLCGFFLCSIGCAQTPTQWKPHDRNRPVPPVIDPGVSSTQDVPGKAPSDAIALFDGKDLSGWDGSPDLWSVRDGAITGQTTPEHPAKENTFLIWTGGRPANFELACSFRIMANNKTGFANSGIQYRSKDFDNFVVGGYQADMEAGDNYTGILYEERMTRAIMAERGQKVVWDKDCKKQVTGSLGKAEEIQAAIRKRDWNDYVIVARSNHLQHFINGKQTVDVTDDEIGIRTPTNTDDFYLLTM